MASWLSAKGVSSRQQLDDILRELGIDPATFPQEAADKHLGSLQSEPHEIHSAHQEVEPAVSGVTQTATRKVGKRSSQAPT